MVAKDLLSSPYYKRYTELQHLPPEFPTYERKDNNGVSCVVVEYGEILCRAKIGDNNEFCNKAYQEPGPLKTHLQKDHTYIIFPSATGRASSDRIKNAKGWYHTHMKPFMEREEKKGFTIDPESLRNMFNSALSGKRLPEPAASSPTPKATKVSKRSSKPVDKDFEPGEKDSEMAGCLGPLPVFGKKAVKAGEANPKKCLALVKEHKWSQPCKYCDEVLEKSNCTFQKGCDNLKLFGPPVAEE